MNASVNRSIWRLETRRPGTTIFSAGASGQICCFDVRSVSETSCRNLNAGWINGLAYCAKTDSLAVATSRGKLFALDASTLETRGSLSIEYWLNGMKCLGENSYLVTTAEGGIFIWDANTNGVNWFNDHHSDQVWNCVVTKDSRLAATVGGNGELALWDLSRRELIRRFSIGGHTLTAVVMLESRGLIAAVDMGGLLTLWGIKSGQPICRFSAHDTRTWSMAVSEDERRIVTAGADRRVVVWDVESLRILHEHAVNGLPTACKVHEPSRQVVAGDRAGVIHLLDDGSISHTTPVASVAAATAIASDRVVAFVNGSSVGKTGNHSANLLAALDKAGVACDVVDVSDSPLRRQSLARLSGCPLFPQLYVDGKFVGGSEVVSEMLESGAFYRVFKIQPNEQNAKV